MAQKEEDKRLKKKNSNSKQIRMDAWLTKESMPNNSRSKRYVHSTLKSYEKTTAAHQMKVTSMPNANSMLWTKASNSPRSRPVSSRKTYTHTSLTDKSSTQTAKSSNFEKSSDVKMEDRKVVSDDDSLPDEILNMNINQNLIANTNDTSTSYKKSTRKIDEDQKVSFMENHFCPMCSNLMFDKANAPQIVFPCGHTFCLECLAETLECPSCHCKIISTQHNDALFMIIQRFKQKQEKEELERKEKEVRRYLQEYDNFDTRIKVLKNEATMIIDGMENVTHQLIEKKDTLKSIEQSSSEVKKQQRILQDKLNGLDAEYELEKNSMIDLESEYEKQKKQLRMLEQTINSIEKNKNDLKAIISELSPSSIFQASRD